eukprot:scaffold2156_cov115-Cylindrotheca_fusiformis.AAC.29
MDFLLPTILSYLPWKDIVTKIRRVNRTFRDAVQWTPVALVEDDDNDDDATIVWTASHLQDLVKCIPRLQRLRLRGAWLFLFCLEQEEMLRQIVTGWKDLKHLDISTKTNNNNLNSFQQFFSSSTPFAAPATHKLLFHNLNQLTYLDVSGNGAFLVADLEDVATLSNLEVLNCQGSLRLTGSLSSLATASLHTTLHVCDLKGCLEVTGHVRDLMGCQELLYLGLRDTSVHGTLADVQVGDYPSLIYVDWIHGGAMDSAEEEEEDASLFIGTDLASVSSASVAVQRVYQLYKILPSIRLSLCTFYLSSHSPDFYSKPRNPSGVCWSRDPPFRVEILNVGGRIGWRWTNGTQRGACDIRWIDTTTTTSSHYGLLDFRHVAVMEEDSIYQGLLDPPTEEEHNDLMYKKLIVERRRRLLLQQNETY